MARVYIQSHLRHLTLNRGTCEANGDTVKDVLDSLVVMFPELSSMIFKTDGTISAQVNIYIDGMSFRPLKNESTPVHRESRFFLTTFFSGG